MINVRFDQRVSRSQLSWWEVVPPSDDICRIFCRILGVAGLLARLEVIPFFITMIVAFFIAYGGDPFSSRELPLTFLLLSIVVFKTSSSNFSADQLFQNNKS